VSMVDLVRGKFGRSFLKLFFLLCCCSFVYCQTTVCLPSVNSVTMNPTHFVGGVGPYGSAPITATMVVSVTNPCNEIAYVYGVGFGVPGPFNTEWLSLIFRNSQGVQLSNGTPYVMPPHSSDTLTGIGTADPGTLTVANPTTYLIRVFAGNSRDITPATEIEVTFTPNLPALSIVTDGLTLTSGTGQKLAYAEEPKAAYSSYQRDRFEYNPPGYLTISGSSFILSPLAPAITEPVTVTVTDVPSFWAFDLGYWVDGPRSSITITILPLDSNDEDDSANLGSCPDEDGDLDCGMPINIATGNTHIAKKDISIPGLAGGLMLERVWNSALPITQVPNVNGIFGHSWRSTFEESVQINATPARSMGQANVSVVRYWRGDGSSWDFQFISSTAGYQLIKPLEQHAMLNYDSVLGRAIIRFKNGTVRTFDAANNYALTSVVDRNGNAVTLAYNDSGNLTKVTGASGSVLSFQYGNVDFPNLVTSISSPAGNVQYLYDTKQRLTRVTYADNTFINYTYDGNSLITAVTDSNGALIEGHIYDGYRRGLTSSRGSGSDLLRLVYLAGSTQLQTSTNSATIFNHFSINGKRRLQSASGPGCASCGIKGSVNYTYDSVGNKTSATDALGHTVNFTYDGLGNIISRSADLGNGQSQTWAYTYNEFSQVTSSTDPLGNITFYVYDGKGNLLSVTSPPPK